MNIFQNHEPDDNRRPDILIRNPHGGGKQIIIDVAVTDIDDTTRKNDDKPEQPLVTRRKQKKGKYGPTAKLNGLAFFAAIFSHAGEMDVIIINLLLQQIKYYKLQLVDVEVKKSKVRAIMKLCVRHISTAINRSASRNIFLKATKMVNVARHTQQNFSSSTSCDLTSYSSSSSPEDLLQQFELQIMNQVKTLSKSKFHSQIWKTLDTCLQ